MLRLPAALGEPRHPLRAIAVGWLLACPISLLLSAFFHWLLPAAEPPHFDIGGPMLIFLLVIFSPFVETLIMRPNQSLIRTLRRKVPLFVIKGFDLR